MSQGNLRSNTNSHVTTDMGSNCAAHSLEIREIFSSTAGSVFVMLLGDKQS